MPDLAWTDFANPRFNLKIKKHWQILKKELLVKNYATTTRRAYWDWNNTNLGIEDLGQINVTFPGNKWNR